MYKKRASQVVVTIFLMLISLVSLLAEDTEDAKPAASVDDIKESVEGEESKEAYTAEQEYLFDIFKKRRSVRKFKSTPIPKEHIIKILGVACSAPTAGNQQPWKFLVIQDRDKLNQLKEENIALALERAKKREDFDPAKLDEKRQQVGLMYDRYLSAPVHIIVLVDSNSKYPSYNLYDGALAAGYLLIAARSLGYGTVFTTDIFPYETTKRVFKIPDNYKQICFIPVGVPDKWPESLEKKSLQEFIVFEKFADQ
ncbi:nitroreductase family protein [Candidatus Poribacteria bacterium]